MLHEVERSSAEFLAFNSRGKLVRGIHRATWDEFMERFIYNEQRLWLVQGLLAASLFLRAAGCMTVYVGGSFTSSKREPMDLDVCWKSEEVNWDYLDELAPVFTDPGIEAGDVIKELFRGDYFPSEGIEGISKKTFLEFFQWDRQNRRRGVVALDIRVLPRREEMRK